MDRALIFCTAHLQSDPSRYQLWAKYYAEAFKNHNVDLLMVNDGPCDPADKPPEVELIVLEPHLGRHSMHVFPGWKRSFAFALRTAMDRGYRWIGHVESDLYIKPQAIAEFIEQLHCENGYGSGWCRTYSFPEASLLVLNDHRINGILLERYSTEVGWNEDIDFEHMLWSLGPGRMLEGDRFEGHIERLLQSDSYVAAIHFRDVEQTRRIVDRAIPFSTTLEIGSTDIVVAGLATLNRPDCADKCIESLLRGSRVPDQIFVVDNGGQFKNRFGSIVTVLDFGRNLGLSASLNVLRRESAGEDIVILNDDVMVGDHTFERMVSCPGWFVSAFRFSCFLVREECFARVGGFDEQFWPLYYEDTDFLIRMQLEVYDDFPIDGGWALSGIPPNCRFHPGGIVCVEGATISHHDGGFRSRLPWMEPFFALNRNRLSQKWQQVQIRKYQVWGESFKGSPAPYLTPEHLLAERRLP